MYAYFNFLFLLMTHDNYNILRNIHTFSILNTNGSYLNLAGFEIRYLYYNNPIHVVIYKGIYILYNDYYYDYYK